LTHSSEHFQTRLCETRFTVLLAFWPNSLTAFVSIFALSILRLLTKLKHN